jgi:hypothetical protein
MLRLFIVDIIGVFYEEILRGKIYEKKCGEKRYGNGEGDYRRVLR